MTIVHTPRIPPVTTKDIDAETGALFDKGLRGADGTPLNIFATLANHPKVLKRWLPFATHVLTKNSLPERERELLILRTGFNCRSRYEWGQHVLIARRCGITDDEIGAVRVGPDATSWSIDDRIVLRAADQLHVASAIDDETWSALAGRFSTEQLLDLVATVGNYHLVAFWLNSARVELDDGVPDDLG
jgi:4-carboxymuconolactone decarboxylase